ncbi:MAG TPA: prolipoprotein diacylglyceryl transferase, partial [Candidatus Dormibacteraeota bacterium]|nr:prolipoprotein diacylglyceryl transferase [Candidatus Dormibacteraeota bacterium]
MTGQMPATINIDIDPVLHIGGLGIHWYGILYAVAFAVALYLGAVPHLEKRGVDRAVVERYATWAIVAGLIGARLYYVVQSSPPQGGSWFSHPEEIPAVWHGGMAFFGAIIAVPLVMAVLAWRDGHNWWLWADGAAIFATMGQPIGRIGNIVNGDILGYASTLPWATSYSNPNAVLQSGFDNCSVVTPCTAYQPAAVYEALGTLAILGILVLLRQRRNPRAGLLFIVYIALYCVSQFLIFFLRGSESTVALGLKQAQWTALVIGLVAVPAMVWAWQRDLIDWAPVGTQTGALVGAGKDGDGEEDEEDDDEPPPSAAARSA